MIRKIAGTQLIPREVSIIIISIYMLFVYSKHPFTVQVAQHNRIEGDSYLNIIPDVIQ